MLLFNGEKLDSLGEIFKFQNISCYCLTGRTTVEKRAIEISKHLMLLFNKIELYQQDFLTDFKTSHVIV